MLQVKVLLKLDLQAFKTKNYTAGTHWHYVMVSLI